MAHSSIISLAHGLSTIVMLVFYVAALGYVISRRTDRSSAKSLATFALAMMLLLHLGSSVFTYWISRVSMPVNAALWIPLFSIASSLCYMVAIGMLVAAVFAQRPAAELSGLPGEERMPVDLDNPYSPPTV